MTRPNPKQELINSCIAGLETTREYAFNLKKEFSTKEDNDVNRLLHSTMHSCARARDSFKNLTGTAIDKIKFNKAFLEAKKAIGKLGELETELASIEEYEMAGDAKSHKESVEKISETIKEKLISSVSRRIGGGSSGIEGGGRGR